MSRLFSCRTAITAATLLLAGSALAEDVRDTTNSGRALSDKQNLPFREAVYRMAVEDPLETSGRILADQERKLYADRADYAEMLLGNTYLALGLHWQASSAYYELLQRDDRMPITDQAWYQMAQTQFHRGYLGLTGLVEYALSRIRPDAPKELLAKKSLLLGQLYLEQGRFNDAAKLLDEWKGPRELKPYVEYNLGVALINNGNRKDGMGQLSGVGRFNARDNVQAALRDKANLVMAYELLKDGQGGTARPVLKRIRVNGPHSNKALLAMGWAYIGPQGDYQTRAGVQLQGCLPPEVESIGGLAGILRPREERCDEATEIMSRFQKNPSKADRYRDALTPWLVLKQRDPNDLAVQEALLAVPHAFLELDAKRQAMRHYQDAVAVFSREREQLALAIKNVRNDGLTDLLLAKTEIASMPGKVWELEQFPKTEETFRLARLIAGAPFQEALRGYAELQFLERKQAEWRARLDRLEIAIGPGSSQRGPRRRGGNAGDSDVRRIIDARSQLAEQRSKLTQLKQQQERYVRSLALKELNRQRDFVNVYLAEAQLGLGSIYDNYVEDDERRADEVAADKANQRGREDEQPTPETTSEIAPQ